ncbi:MAG: hypothetical protein ACT4QC_09290 [Planctomycetaceae bacterium]
MPSRRELLKVSAVAGLASAVRWAPFFAGADGPGGIEVNDVQSQLNSTRVYALARARSIDDLQSALRLAARRGRATTTTG